MNTRIATVNISINHKDITRDVAPFLTGFTYTDNLSGEADSAEITLQDRDFRWRDAWFPSRRDTATIELVRKNWSIETGTEILPLGNFEIDEIANGYPPNTATIKLVSIPNNAKIRSINKTRPWENVKLSKIARDIADDANMELFFDAQDDPDIKRAEQSNESSLQFLEKQCTNNGLALKVNDEKIIIFDEEKYEQQMPVLTLHYGQTHILSFKGSATVHEIYSACHVKYKHGKQNEYIEYTYKDPGKDDGMVLEVNKKVESLAEAEKLAKKLLRNKNKEEIKVNLSVTGNFLFVAGNVIELAGHGFYDGNYLITKATHKIGGGYTADVELRRCLSGY